MRIAHLPLLFAAVLAAAPAADAGEPRASARSRAARDEVPAGPEALVREARAGLAERLNKVASWCNLKHLFAERDRIWRRVLEIEPDDASARKGLRYARNLDGSWKEPEPRAQVNRNEKALLELPVREAEAEAAFGDELLALVKDPACAPEARARFVAEIEALTPGHAGYHAWLGDVELEGKWVLPETARAKTRRAELRARAQELAQSGPGLAQGGPELVLELPTEGEAALGVTWEAVVQGPNVRVLSTVGEDDARAVARIAEAVGPLLAAGLGGTFEYPAGFTLYVLANAGERAAFLAALPGVPGADRARLAGLEGTGIPGTRNVALFSTDPTHRLDGAARHTFGSVLGNTIGLDARTGWAWEGIGLYLTRELVGTRLTWFVSGTADPAAVSLRSKLTQAETNWIQEGYTALAAPEAPPIAEILSRDLDRLDVPSALVSYVFAAYLLEGRPEQAGEFVRRTAARELPGKVSYEVLGLEPAELHARVLRWLSERR